MLREFGVKPARLARCLSPKKRNPNEDSVPVDGNHFLCHLLSLDSRVLPERQCPKAEVFREWESIFAARQICGSGHSISECHSERRNVCGGALPPFQKFYRRKNPAAWLSGVFGNHTHKTQQF